MLLLGDNTRFGHERVELTEERFVEPIATEGDPFPLGVAGLIPVVTSRRKKGGFKTVYAFPLPEGELVPGGGGEGAAENNGDSDTAGEPPAAAGPDAAEAGAAGPDAAEADAADPDDAVEGDRAVEGDPAAEGDLAAEGDPASRLAFELGEAIDFVNLLLSEARELSGYPFGQIGAIWAEISNKGYAFSRVELAPLDDLGNPGITPIHLRIETSDRASAPDSVSAVIEYDRLGYPLHVLINEFGEDGAARRIISSVDFDEGDILVQKVVEDLPGEGEPLVLYWRHPPYWFGQGGDADYGDREGGASDRRAVDRDDLSGDYW